MTMSVSRRWRWSRLAVVVVLSSLVWCQPQTASAWHGHWRGGWGHRPWCGPAFGAGFYGPRVYGGWGGWYGGTRFAYSDSVFLGGAGGGFFSGTLRGYTFGAPGWCGPVWGGYGWPGGYPAYAPYAYPYGCGWGWNPVVVPSPIIRWIAPVYGPRPVMPWLGFGFADTAPVARPAALAETQQLMAAARPAAAPPAPQFAAPQPARAVAMRSSNGLARLRAGRLVAVGDRHLRSAVHDPAKLSAALDAYRRAATIAPDLPDTHLRQAVVLTALDRGDDATRAIERAIAIDARLGSDPAAALAAREQLPPDPVFGERPDTGPTSLESRGRDLLARIFTEPAAGRANGVAAAAPAGLNWIADRWTRLHGDSAAGFRADAVAAK
jgi:hypothetical protein